MRKKSISIIISFFIFISCLWQNQSTINGTNLSDNLIDLDASCISIAMPDEDEDGYGYLSDGIDADVTTADLSLETDDDISISSYTSTSGTTLTANHNYATTSDTTIYSASYENTNLTSIKNQGENGMCWTFSAAAACEGELIQNNSANIDSIDISETHIAYFGYHRYADPLGNFSADLGKDYANLYNSIGGNDFITIAELAAWQGAVTESTLPIGAIDGTGTTSLASMSSSQLQSLAFSQDAYHLQNAYLISSSDENAIKNAILQYGSVTICFYYNVAYDTDEKGTTDDEKTHAYYCNTSTTANHQVLIVGWDDYYSTSNYSALSSQPSSNGAWICRNSWGSDWGDSGNFYISYEDATIDSIMCAYDMESVDNYDNNYQYDCDISGAYYYNRYTGKMTNGVPYKCANVFTAKANSTGAEILKAVSFMTLVGNGEYTINIYRNLTSSTNPESGTLVDTLTGTYAYAGYHTIATNKDIILSEGGKYSIVVNNVSSSGNTTIGVNSATGAANTDSSVANGCCFINADSKWYDVNTLSYYGLDSAICIKAFTENTSGLSLSSCDISLEQDTYTCDGTAKTPAVTLTYQGQTIPSSAYSVSYANNTNAGAATVTVAPSSLGVVSLTIGGQTGDYGLIGSASKNFTINEAAQEDTETQTETETKVTVKSTKITKAKNTAKKTVTLTWSKNKNVTGYIIKYDKKSSGFKNSSTKTVKGASKTSLKISGLTKGKTAYFKIRCYKKVNGSKYYSSWSKVVKVKIKK